MGREPRTIGGGKRGGSLADDVRVPAGWYPDPLGLPQLRWWDNHAWTEHVSEARTPMGNAGGAEPEPVRAGAAAGSAAGAGTAIPTVVRTTRLSFADPFEDYEDDDLGVESAPGFDDAEPVGDTAFADPVLSLETLEAPEIDEAEEIASPAHRIAAGHVPAGAPTGRAYNLDTRFDDLLGVPIAPEEAPEPEQVFSRAASASSFAAAEFPTRRSLHRDRAPSDDFRAPEHSNTGAVWAIALMPLLILVFGLLFLLSGLAGGQGSSTFFGIVLMVPYMLSLWLAFTDWQGLKQLGFSRPAHWAWSFLTAPVYLAMRSRRAAAELGRGYAPLVTWLSMGLLIVMSVLVAPGLVLSLSPQTFSNEAAASVEGQAASFGVFASVECPPTPPLLPGDSFTCSATMEDGRAVGITVSLQRSLGWIAWHVDDWGGMSR